MRFLSYFFILFLSSCVSKLKNVESNPPPIKNEFNLIDSNKDYIISQEEYELYKQAEYNSIDPAGWFNYSWFGISTFRSFGVFHQK